MLVVRAGAHHLFVQVIQPFGLPLRLAVALNSELRVAHVRAGRQVGKAALSLAEMAARYVCRRFFRVGVLSRTQRPITVGRTVPTAAPSAGTGAWAWAAPVSSIVQHTTQTGVRTDVIP
jgi:hypothetical protein